MNVKYLDQVVKYMCTWKHFGFCHAYVAKLCQNLPTIHCGVSAFANPDYKDRSVDRSRFESHVGGIMVEGEEMKDRWIRR